MIVSYYDVEQGFVVVIALLRTARGRCFKHIKSESMLHNWVINIHTTVHTSNFLIVFVFNLLKDVLFSLSSYAIETYFVEYSSKYYYKGCVFIILLSTWKNLQIEGKSYTLNCDNSVKSENREKIFKIPRYFLTWIPNYSWEYTVCLKHSSFSR